MWLARGAGGSNPAASAIHHKVSEARPATATPTKKNDPPQSMDRVIGIPHSRRLIEVFIDDVIASAAPRPILVGTRVFRHQNSKHPVLAVLSGRHIRLHSGIERARGRMAGSNKGNNRMETFAEVRCTDPVHVE